MASKSVCLYCYLIIRSIFSQNYVVDDSFEKAKGTELDEPEKNVSGI